MSQFIQRLFPLAVSDLEFGFNALELDLELEGRRYNYTRQHGIGVGPNLITARMVKVKEVAFTQSFIVTRTITNKNFLGEFGVIIVVCSLTKTSNKCH